VPSMNKSRTSAEKSALWRIKASILNACTLHSRLRQLEACECDDVSGSEPSGVDAVPPMEVHCDCDRSDSTSTGLVKAVGSGLRD